MPGFESAWGLCIGRSAAGFVVEVPDVGGCGFWDGDTQTITVDLEPVAHTLRPGESVTLQLVSSAGLYQPIARSSGTLTVSSMQVSVPTADPTAVAWHREQAEAIRADDPDPNDPPWWQH